MVENTWRRRCGLGSRVTRIAGLGTGDGIVESVSDLVGVELLVGPELPVRGVPRLCFGDRFVASDCDEDVTELCNSVA
ncbi:hypothetical protein ACFQER_06080 [Halomicroarcula sp. GCM10025894]|uniref:hypothetical protein n=1 Tax=Halomicroarcula sp. GCM10025894 TaxID=3252673 RepID=UPI0036221C64